MTATSTLVTAQQILDRGPFGGRGRGMGGHPIVFLAVAAVLVIGSVALLVLAVRHDWFRTADRRRREFDDWHRLAHSAPVPTGPVATPWPVSTTTYTMPPAAAATPTPTPAPAPTPAAPPEAAPAPAPDAADPGPMSPPAL